MMKLSKIKKELYFLKLQTRALLSLGGLVFMLFLHSSCQPSSKKDPQTSLNQNPEGGASAECSTVPKCQLRCTTTFETSKKLYDKCLEETSDDVIELDKAISGMEKGNWKVIKAESLKVLVDFDQDIWPKYAGVRNKTTVQEMLLWIAENEDIAEHVYQKVLEQAFYVLGANANKGEMIREGLKVYVDTKENRSFFEVSAFKKNRKAFEEAHKLITEECSKDPYCLKKFYCELNKTLVFGKLNQYGLAQDTQKSGSLYQADCSN